MRIGLFYQIQVPKPGSWHWHIIAERQSQRPV